MKEAIRATSKEVTTTTKSASHGTTQPTGHQHAGKSRHAQRARGEATCVVRFLKRRQLHGKKQAGFDPETDAQLHNNAKHIAEGREKQLAKRMQLDATRWAALAPEVWQTSLVASHEQ